MNPLESQKQLLIAESELNRAELVRAWQAMTSEVHSLTSRAGTISSIASSVASLVAALASCQRKTSTPGADKPSWWQTILNGAGLLSTIWSKLRAQSHGRDES
jgi:hypothetical protein